MKRSCIAVVDAARARLYTYQEGAEPGRDFCEIRDLVNAGRRDDHVANMDARFAKEVVEELIQIVSGEAYGHVILIASPKMLGELRKANGSLERNGMVVDEIPRDLANLSATQLHDHLASLDLIPGRQRLKIAR